jgi:hypothetical protein
MVSIRRSGKAPSDSGFEGIQDGCFGFDIRRLAIFLRVYFHLSLGVSPGFQRQTEIRG